MFGEKNFVCFLFISFCESRMLQKQQQQFLLLFLYWLDLFFITLKEVRGGHLRSLLLLLFCVFQSILVS